MSLIRKVDIGFKDSPAIDSFGRLRISNPVTFFDSKQIFDDDGLASNVENQPLFYDNQETSGGGTSTAYNANKAETVLTVGATTAGTRVRQSRMRFNYQSGKSLLVYMSFLFGTQTSGITRREGYFDDKNGIFLEDDGTNYNVVRRTYVTSSAVDNDVPQSSWNIDKMDGTGSSGITLDFTKTQILVLDFEWLGVGRVRVGFVIAGLIYYVHEFLNANSLSTVYMSTPNLPLRSEISNDGTAVSSTLTQICASVMSEGGFNDLGIKRSASTNGTHVDCDVENTIYAILGIRLKSEYIGATIKLLNISMQIHTASHKCEWLLFFNPTVAGSFTYSDESQSAVQIARGATANTVTGGYRIDGGHLESGGVPFGGSGSGGSEIENAILLGSLIDGTVDSIVLCARPIGGSTNVDVEAALNWREIT